MIRIPGRSVPALALLLCLTALPARGQSWRDRLKKKVEKAAAGAVDGTAGGDRSAPAPGQATAASPGTQSVSAAEPPLAAYQNYDFVPGDSIVFDDDFRSDQDGEFAAHWHLADGQGVVNRLPDGPAFVLTDGLDAVVYPRVTPDSYLGRTFTVEFDYFAKEDAWAGLNLGFLKAGQGDVHDRSEGQIDFGTNGDVHVWGLPNSREMSGPYPGDKDAFANHWHHAAFVIKDGQLKAYVDQYRVLIFPDFPIQPVALTFFGRADLKDPLRFRNVRIANGGDMNLTSELSRTGRIITHGILFDVDKADVKPQSMGTVRRIVAMLKETPSVKVEIGGHTDSDGDAAHNLALSQERADAVEKLLVAQGIDPARLTTKGYGETRPIASNDTPEGKANNRRVEFVKQ